MANNLKAGQVVLAYGGGGNVGIGALAILLKQGVNVVVPSRSAERIEVLKKRFAEHSQFLHGVVTKDYVSAESYAHVKKFVVDKFGEDGLDHVLSSQGNDVVEKTDISGTSAERLLAAFTGGVVSHHHTVQHFYPLLLKSKNPSPSFTFMTGLSGEFVVSTKLSLMTICNSALYGYILTLQKEAEPTKVRVNEFRLGTLVADADIPDRFLEHEAGSKVYAPRLSGAVIVAIMNSTQKGKKIDVRTDEDYDTQAKLT